MPAMSTNLRACLAVLLAWILAADAGAADPPPPARPQTPGWLLLGEFAADLQRPGALLGLPNGDLLVAEHGGGRVVLLRDADRDGRADRRVVLREGLERPDGLLLRRDRLYVAHAAGVDDCPFLVGQLQPIPACRTLAPGSGAARALAMSPDEQALYALIDGRVTAFAPAGAGRPVDAVPGPGFAGIAVEPRGGRVWRALPGPAEGPPYVLAPVTTPPPATLPADAGAVTLLFYRRRALPEDLLGAALLALPPRVRDGALEPARIVAVPFRDGAPAGPARELLVARDDAFVPGGLAVMNDGSLVVADAAQGRLWRLTYLP
jgi:glucose/arabinose dehydrogenase